MVARGLAAGVASLRTPRGRGPGKRLQSLNASNVRLSTRRAALRALNDLLEEVQADAVSLDHRSMPAPEALDRVLRLLERRCVATGQQQRFEEAVRQWADNGGMLPPGIRLRDASVEFCLDAGETAPCLPRHRLLLKSYGFQSKAFMLTFNSPKFNAEQWPAFLQFVKELAKRLGARCWSACWEDSLKGVTVTVHVLLGTA